MVHLRFVLVVGCFPSRSVVHSAGTCASACVIVVDTLAATAATGHCLLSEVMLVVLVLHHGTTLGVQMLLMMQRWLRIEHSTVRCVGARHEKNISIG